MKSTGFARLSMYKHLTSLLRHFVRWHEICLNFEIDT